MKGEIKILINPTTLAKRAVEYSDDENEQASFMDGYFAGYAEAMRWCDAVKEQPLNGQEVIVMTEDSTLAFATYEEMFLLGMGFRATNGGLLAATHWRPIGPLPTTNKEEE